MNDSLLIVAGFGTTSLEGRIHSLDALERHLAASFPGWTVRRVFTSEKIRAYWRDRGEHIASLESALDQAAREGVRHALVLPTHVIAGRESEALITGAKACGAHFSSMRVGSPLLATAEDIDRAARTLASAVPEEPGLCRVFMGHGAKGPAASAYRMLAAAFGDIGRDDVFVGCMEGDALEEDYVRVILNRGPRALEIRPLMLVAGDTFAKGLDAGGGKRLIENVGAAGIPCRIVAKGLGEYPEIRELYAERAREAVRSCSGGTL